MEFVWIAIVAYLVLQLSIGAWLTKKINSEADYFLAGRSLGLGLTTFSIFATWFGAETCIGSSAAIFQDGLSGSRADPFGYTVCLLLLGLFLAAPLWKRQLTTLADLYRQRYSTNVEQVAVWLNVAASFMWTAAQIRGFGQILSVVTPLDFEIGTAIATCVVIAYTFMGGIWGDVITDFVQGILLIVGLAVIFVVAVMKLGGPAAVIASIDPSKLSFSAAGEPLWQRLDAWMVPILGSMVAQELVSRVLASRSGAIAKRASFMAAGIYLSIGLIPVFLGLIGGQFPLTLTDHEQFLPTLARHLLPDVLFVVFVGALISAILSTVDSSILSVSALVSHNVIIPRLPSVTERRKVGIARAICVATGVLAYFFAVFADSMYGLVEATSSFGTAGVLVITLFGLWGKFGGAKAAMAALIVGVVVTPLARYVFELPAPFITSVAASLFAYVTVELWTRNRQQLEVLTEQLQKHAQVR